MVFGIVGGGYSTHREHTDILRDPGPTNHYSTVDKVDTHDRNHLTTNLAAVVVTDFTFKLFFTNKKCIQHSAAMFFI